MNNQIQNVLREIYQEIRVQDQHIPLRVGEYLSKVALHSERHLRSIFQFIYDMVHGYLGEGVNEYPDDPENINYVRYDSDRLFVEGVDHPFFADRPLTNRIVNRIADFRRGSGQNKLYIFVGPPGSGKSTFMNILLDRLEQYTRTEKGACYEVVWYLEKDKIRSQAGEAKRKDKEDPTLIVPCPSHDHPILLFPKDRRRALLDRLITDEKVKGKLFTEKPYEWIFKKEPCTICHQLYEALLEILGSPDKVFDMVRTRRFQFNRRLGQGITVFNAGDQPTKEQVITNTALQEQLDALFHDSARVRYVYSRYANTNNGVYALMDVKDYNLDRYFNLHGILSEGVHKVSDIEENVNSIFFAVMNPGDDRIEERGRNGRPVENGGRKKGTDQSFEDRKVPITIPYILDFRAEIKVYENDLGAGIRGHFLPQVLEGFAKAIISTRLEPPTEALSGWIKDVRRYDKFCDPTLQLLRMDIYAGIIPSWLAEDDLKRFTAKVRREVIASSEKEGGKGFTGRDSITAFKDFYQLHLRNGKIVTMELVVDFFRKKSDHQTKVDHYFLEFLKGQYDYHVVQQVKEALYDYNEQRIRADVLSYLYALNYEEQDGEKVRCEYTGEELEISETLFSGLEVRIFGGKVNPNWPPKQRSKIQSRYASETLTREMRLEKKQIEDTKLFNELLQKSISSQKENVLAPILHNDNFRRAIKDFGTKDFEAYDERIRRDVSLLMAKLTQDKFGYTESGAREICIYTIDNGLAEKYK